MRWFAEFISIPGGSLLYGVLSAVLFWIGTSFVGKPINALREGIREALRAADRYAYVGYGSSDDLVKTARRTLFDAASSLRSMWHMRSLAVSLYCRCRKIDLELGSWAITGLGSMVGGPYDDTARRRQLDAIHVCLRATRHLSAERRLQIEIMLDEARHSEPPSG